MIFQDPQASLNPRMTVGDIIAEGIDIHKLAKTKKERTEKVYDLLELVGLNREHASRFPHEFSGGQRQRIVIARVMYGNPSIIVMDEATSALDNDTERAVMESIDAMQGDKTLIIVAHRLTTVRNCNHLYELKDGVFVARRYEDVAL